MQEFDIEPPVPFSYSTVLYCPIIMDGTLETSPFSPLTASDSSPLIQYLTP